LGWEADELEGVPLEINAHGEKIECFMQGTRDYIKYLKRGYGRATQIAAFKARSGEIMKDDVVALSSEYDGKIPRSLELFLQYVGLEIDEFYEIVKDNVIAPWDSSNWKSDSLNPTHDFEDWYREK
jgi:hypothetical protein